MMEQIFESTPVEVNLTTWEWAEGFPGEISGLKQNGMRLPSSGSFPVKLLHMVRILFGFHRNVPLMHNTQGIQFKLPFLFLFFGH